MAASRKSAVAPASDSTNLSQALPSQFRILKKSQCPTISSKSDLVYNVGCNPSKALYLRVSDASGGGFWSREWVPVKEILKALDTDGPITSILLWPLFKGKSVNTPGFLLAVLSAEKLIQPKPGKTRVHELCDPKDFQARMAKLVASNTNLPDDAAPKPAGKPKAVKVDLSKRKPGRKPTAKK